MTGELERLEADLVGLGGGPSSWANWAARRATSGETRLVGLGCRAGGEGGRASTNEWEAVEKDELAPLLMLDAGKMDPVDPLRPRMCDVASSRLSGASRARELCSLLLLVASGKADHDAGPGRIGLEYDGRAKEPSACCRPTLLTLLASEKRFGSVP